MSADPIDITEGRRLLHAAEHGEVGDGFRLDDWTVDNLPALLDEVERLREEVAAAWKCREASVVECVRLQGVLENILLFPNKQLDPDSVWELAKEALRENND